MAERPDFGFDAPDADGFRRWRYRGTGGFADIFGGMSLRDEGEGRSRCRVWPEARHTNIAGSLHGGFIMAFVDQSIFAGPFLQGRIPPGGVVTMAASTTFLSPGRPGLALDAAVEITGETRRMIFLRGLIEQGGERVAMFDGALRKMPGRHRAAPAEQPA